MNGSPNGFDENVLYMLALVVAIFSTIKIILVPSKRSFKKAVASMFVGFPVGVLAGLLSIYEFGFSIYVGLVISSLFSLIGENIVLFVVSGDGQKFQEYMDRIMKNLIDKWTK